MHAIIETGGKQYKVAEGDVLFIEKLPQEAGDAIKFDKVLAILGDAQVRRPVVEGASRGRHCGEERQGARRSGSSSTIPRRAIVCVRAIVSPTPRLRSPRSTPDDQSFLCNGR